MTKLEQKLIELGYERNSPIKWVFIKRMNDINISICYYGMERSGR